jgi:hypothetical protein
MTDNNVTHFGIKIFGFDGTDNASILILESTLIHLKLVEFEYRLEPD